MEVSDVLNLQVNTCLKLLCNLRTKKYIRNSRTSSEYRLVGLCVSGKKVNRRVKWLHQFRNVLYMYQPYLRSLLI
jgi:DNA-binding IclR family transcriptional regulator